MKSNICLFCNNLFLPYRRVQKFCSQTCAQQMKSSKAEKIITLCKMCNLEIVHLKCAPRKFCSRKCRNKFDSINFVGDGNPNFGKRRKGMYKHTLEERQKIQKAVSNSWKTKERMEKHKNWQANYKKQHGYIPINSPSSQLKIALKTIKRIQNGASNPWKNCKSGNYTSSKTGIVEKYDSSYEFNRMCELDNDDTVKTWSKKHKHKIKYLLDGKKRTYLPDFCIVYTTGEIFIEEIKGYVSNLKEYWAKVLAAEQYCKKYGFKYRVNFMSNKINEAHCEKNKTS